MVWGDNMKFPWVEKMVKEGKISERARDQIYADCHQLIKVATIQRRGSAAAKMLQGSDAADTVAKGLQTILSALGATAILGGASLAAEGVGKKFQAGRNIALHRDLVSQNKEKLKSLFPGREDKVDSRVSEVAAIAPSVAANLPVMSKFLETRLNSGLTDQDVTRLAAIQSAHTPDFRTQVHLTRKVASESKPEVVGSILGDVYQFSKVAGIDVQRLKKFLKTYGAIASIPVGVGVGAGGVQELSSYRDKQKLEKGLAHSFSQAMELSDPNQEPLHDNKEKANEAFKALTHFAPHVALQPQAARAFMNKLVAYDQGMNISDIKDLSEIERNLQGVTKASPFFTGLVGGTKALGLQSLSSEAVKRMAAADLDSLAAAGA